MRPLASETEWVSLWGFAVVLPFARTSAAACDSRASSNCYYNETTSGLALARDSAR